MSLKTSSAPTLPLMSMSTNSSNARHVSTNTPVKTYHKTPGSAALPMSGVLVKTGVTQKTPSTARKSASISNPEFPALTKMQSTLRRPSEDHLSDSAGVTRAKSTSSASPSSSSAIKSLQLSKKRKRGPFSQNEDDAARSDILSSREANTTTGAMGNKSQNSASSESRASQDVTRAAETPSTPSADPQNSEPTVVDLDMLEETTPVSGPTKSVGISKETNDRLRPIQKKQSILNFNRVISHPEVITIDSDDDEPPPKAVPRCVAPVALVEADGEAAIIPTAELRGLFPTSKASNFAQTIRSFQLYQQTAKTLTSAARPAPILNAKNSVDTEVAKTQNADDEICIIGEQILKEQSDSQGRENLSVGKDDEADESSQELNKETKAEKCPQSINAGSVDTTTQYPTPPVTANVEETNRGASVTDQITPTEGVQSSSGKEGDKPPQVSDAPRNALSREQTPQSSSLALDRNIPGVRGEIVRRHIDLEDKYARELREKARYESQDRIYVTHEFFRKCIDPLSTPHEELESMVQKLEHTIFMLYEEASQYIISQQFYKITSGVLLRGRIDNYFIHDRHELGLDERLRKLLKEITVMTFAHLKVTFQKWVDNGQQDLEGKIVLSTESILELVDTHKRISAEIEKYDRALAAHKEADGNLGNRLPAANTDGQNNVAVTALDTVVESNSRPLPSEPNTDPTIDVEMTDAVGEAVDSLGRRNSLIVKLAASPTLLRGLDRPDTSHTGESQTDYSEAQSAHAHSENAHSMPCLNSPRLSKPNARAKSSKGVNGAGSSHIGSIMDQMNHFGNSRIEQLNTNARERHDPYLRRIRQLDQEKDRIRFELRKLVEESAQKSAEFDKQLTLLLHEADFLDQEAKLNGLGPNGYLPADRDLKWEQYQRLHREKADHESDVAAAKDKLIRRGLSISEEKRRAVVHYEENREFENSIEAKKKEFEQALMMNHFNSLATHSYANSAASTPSTREPSAAPIPGPSTATSAAPIPGSSAAPIPGPDKPVGEETSNSSAPSSVFSEEAASTPATIAPERPSFNKATAFNGLRSLFDSVNSGYGSGYCTSLLAGIRDAALLEAGEAPPLSRISASGGTSTMSRKKKRTVKGW